MIPLSVVAKMGKPIFWLALYTCAFSFFAVLHAIRALITDGYNNPWVIGDWLIDYSGGFVRRGLAGELARILASAFAFDRQDAIIWLQVLMLLAFSLSTFALVFVGHGLPNKLLVLASPLFVSFAMDASGIFRKELALLALLFVLATATYFFRKLSKAAVVIVLISYPMLLLSHEALFFIFPFVALFLVLIDSESTNPSPIKVLLPLGVLSLSAFLMAVLFNGSADQAHSICQSAVSSGADVSVCGGSIEWLAHDTQFALTWVAGQVSQPGYLSAHLLALFLGLLPLLTFNWPRQFKLYVGLSSIFYLAVFFLGSDWGRWIHLYLSMLSLFFLRFSHSRSPKTDLAPKSLTVSVGLVVLVGVYQSSWSLKHCCSPSLDGGLLEVFGSIVLGS